MAKQEILDCERSPIKILISGATFHTSAEKETHESDGDFDSIYIEFINHLRWVCSGGWWVVGWLGLNVNYDDAAQE